MQQKIITVTLRRGRRRSPLTREQRRLRRNQLTGGAVLLGLVLLALSAEGWVELLLPAVEAGV